MDQWEGDLISVKLKKRLNKTAKNWEKFQCFRKSYALKFTHTKQINQFECLYPAWRVERVKVVDI